MFDQLEGRNPVHEALSRGKRQVHRIWLDERAKPTPQLREIMSLADAKGVPVLRVPREQIDKKSKGDVHNGIIAQADAMRLWTTAELLEDLFIQGKMPFLMLADEVNYEHNLGAILRTGLGFGLDGLILPTRRGATLSPVSQRVAMGAAEEIPVVREGLFSAIKHIQKAGIPVICADAKGTPLEELRLTGPVAFVMGGEDKGITSTMRKRCDQVVSIPQAGGLNSYNVSVAAAILMYEKRRQDRVAAESK